MGKIKKFNFEMNKVGNKSIQIQKTKKERKNLNKKQKCMLSEKRKCLIN